MSVVAGFFVGRRGPPTGGSRRLPASRPTGWAHSPGVLSAAGYYGLTLGDDGFVGVSMATVHRLAGFHYSLTPSCLLNGAQTSRAGVGWLLGAPPLGRLVELGCLLVSLWPEGAVAYGPY